MLVPTLAHASSATPNPTTPAESSGETVPAHAAASYSYDTFGHFLLDGCAASPVRPGDIEDPPPTTHSRPPPRSPHRHLRGSHQHRCVPGCDDAWRSDGECDEARRDRAEIAPRSRRDRAEITPRSRRDRAENIGVVAQACNVEKCAHDGAANKAHGDCFHNFGGWPSAHHTPECSCARTPSFSHRSPRDGYSRAIS